MLRRGTDPPGRSISVCITAATVLGAMTGMAATKLVLLWTRVTIITKTITISLRAVTAVPSTTATGRNIALTVH